MKIAKQDLSDEAINGTVKKPVMPPFLFASLSIVPGLGHLMLGRRMKSVTLFAVDFGIVCSIIFIKSIAARLLMGFAYFMVMVPAVFETYILAKGDVSHFSESKPYILVLLLATGFAALPLLWQSSLFSKRSKIAWSIAVPVLALLYVGFLSFYGMRFLNYAKNLLQ